MSEQQKEGGKRRNWFTISVTYFKPSGKFYTSSVFNMEVTDCGQPGHPSCYMAEVTDHLRNLRDCRLSLPGLSSKGWDGYILVDCEEGHPALILPAPPGGEDVPLENPG